jgi:hypothetical protein
VPNVDNTLIDESSDTRLGTDLPQFHTDSGDPNSCVPVISAAVPVVPALTLTVHTVMKRITCLYSTKL